MKKKEEQIISLDSPETEPRDPSSLFCTRCMKGWEDDNPFTVRPRECYACRSGTGKSLKDHSTLMASLRQASEESQYSALEDNNMLRFKPDTQVAKTAYPFKNMQQRHLWLSEPKESLWGDVITARTQYYRRRDIEWLYRAVIRRMEK